MTKQENDELSQFKGTSIEAIKAVANDKGEKKKGAGSGRFYALPDGKSTVRFLPNPVEGKEFFHEAAYHWLGNEKVYCPKPTGVKCPVCAYASRIWQQHESAVEEGNAERAANLKKQAMDLFAKNEYYYNVVVRKADGENDKVAILQTGVSVKKDVTKLFFDEDYRDVTHPKTGHDIVITKSGKGKDTRYSTTPRTQKTLLSGSADAPAEAAKQINEILAQRKNLATLVTFLSTKELEDIVRNYENSLAAGPVSESNEDDSPEVDTSSSGEYTDELDKINSALEQVKAGRS